MSLRSGRSPAKTLRAASSKTNFFMLSNRFRRRRAQGVLVCWRADFDCLVMPLLLSGAATSFEWTRSNTLALALHNCAQCHGAGLRLARRGTLAPCNCVLRSIFRICHDRFIRCVTQERHLSRVSLEPHSGSRPSTWGRKDEEYIADFTLTAKRVLDPFEHRLFFWHMVMKLDWKACSARLRIDRGNFFHAVYRIEQKLGRVFAEMRPYPIWPLDDYFTSGSRRPVLPRCTPLMPMEQRRANPLPFSVPVVYDFPEAA